ncbi:MAG: S-layer homology domain-containing protein [Clostridiales bacterium]|nr:S-layer homology domain-containing protein [Clostridiales bacterium]
MFCENNNLTSLDVSQNVNLEYLFCESNQLTSLDVSKNTALKDLNCSSNQLNTLDVNNNTELAFLDCSYNQLTSLDYRNTSLSDIFYDNNPLEVINGDVLINEYTFPDENFRNWVLSQDYGQDGKLTEAEIADVTSIDVYDKNISNLKGIEFFISLTELDCGDNQLSSLDVSENTALTCLYCNYNELTSLDVSKNTALTQLYCHDNQLISLDVSKNTVLKDFECHKNILNSLNVSNNVALKRLCCDYNNLTSLDVSCNNTLEELHCNDNQLTDLDVSKNTALKDLNCSSNQLTNLDVSKNTALKNLNCSSNQLTSLDVSCNNTLEVLHCNDNQLTDLDVSKNTALKDLNCSSNQLNTLDVNNNTELAFLDCSYNQLTSLDVSENIELVYLDCTCEKLDKVYVHSDTEYFIEKHENTRAIVISKDDFEYSNIVCSGNAADGYQLAAEYVCTKDEDYKITIPVQFTIDSVSPANCVDPEKTTFMVRLSAQDAYDGKEILTKATFDTAPALGHDWKDATCTEPKTCKRCQVTEGNANGHNWGSWTVTTPAKVNEKGVETRKCLACGKEETRDIEAVKPTATPTATSAPKPTTTTPVPANGPSTKPTTAPIVSVALDKKSDSIVCGKTLSLKATLKGTDSKISWKSADSKIASVDSNGKITAKQAGRVTITASAAGKSAACVVTVLYKDVTNTKDFWFAPTNYLTAANVVKGYDKQTNFKPANDCTRAQMVTFLWRLAGEPAPKATTSNFKDIKKTDYFYKPVLWAVEKGITTGVSKTKFDPKGVCTRAQTVTFLWRMAKKPDPKTAKNKFSDVKSKDYFYKAVLWASEKKIVTGYSDGTFKPQGKCLRRQMVTFLYKYDKFVNGKG